MLVFLCSLGGCAHATDLLDPEETVQPLSITLQLSSASTYFALYQFK